LTFPFVFRGRSSFFFLHEKNMSGIRRNKKKVLLIIRRLLNEKHWA
jgi:hypothetical protein